MGVGFREKAAYGLGAVGKDMAYMLSAGYVLYYYQDLLGVSSLTMGAILMAARVFDAFNDPIMGVLVAKTKTRWGRFRPWLLVGTALNAAVLFLMFSAPPSLDGAGLAAYAALSYIIWGVTYTMMDIPFWSMIPSLTKGSTGRETGKTGKTGEIGDRERLTTLARSCAGIGSAIVTITAMKCVVSFGKGDEIKGFRIFAFIVAAVFLICIAVCCLSLREKSTVGIELPSVGEMFRALLRNDQAMTVVAAIVLINCSLYITSNLLIYYFKYDFGGDRWYDSYTVFNGFGGVIQIAAMLLLFPLMRRFMSAVKTFYVSLIMAAAGYGSLLAAMYVPEKSLALLLPPAFLIFASFGIITVLTTVFLANSVDYGELKNGRRDESVIFSMQTLVVKLASGVAALAASVCLALCDLSSDTSGAAVSQASGFSAAVLRMTMTALPIAGVALAALVFSKRYILTDRRLSEIAKELEMREKD